jgi:hypothetical protein
MYCEKLTKLPITDAYLPPLEDVDVDLGQPDHLLLLESIE